MSSSNDDDDLPSLDSASESDSEHSDKSLSDVESVCIENDGSVLTISQLSGPWRQTKDQGRFGKLRGLTTRPELNGLRVVAMSICTTTGRVGVRDVPTNAQLFDRNGGTRNVLAHNLDFGYGAGKFPQGDELCARAIGYEATLVGMRSDPQQGQRVIVRSVQDGLFARQFTVELTSKAPVASAWAGRLDTQIRVSPERIIPEEVAQRGPGAEGGWLRRLVRVALRAPRGTSLRDELLQLCKRLVSLEVHPDEVAQLWGCPRPMSELECVEVELSCRLRKEDFCARFPGALAKIQLRCPRRGDLKWDAEQCPCAGYHEQVAERLTPAMIALQHRDTASARALVREGDERLADRGLLLGAAMSLGFPQFASWLLRQPDEQPGGPARPPPPAVEGDDPFADSWAYHDSQLSPQPAQPPRAWARQTDGWTGRTPLQLAVINGYADLVDELLDLGADPTLPDRTGSHAIALACGFGVQCEHGAPALLPTLIGAAEAMYGEAGLRAALAHADAHGRTALCVAAMRKQVGGERRALLSTLASAGAQFLPTCRDLHPACRALMCERTDCLLPCRRPAEGKAKSDAAREALREQREPLMCAGCRQAPARFRCLACQTNPGYCSADCATKHWFDGGHRYKCVPKCTRFTQRKQPSTAYRFSVGDKVECRVRAGVWVRGVVSRLDYLEPGWIAPVPYQVTLDSGGVIYSHSDTDAHIRKPSRR